MSTQGTPQDPVIGLPALDSIAFVHGDSSQVGSLSRLLRRAAGSVVMAESLGSVPDLSSFALVAVHYDALSESEKSEIVEGFSSRGPRPTLLLLSEKSAQNDFASLFAARALTNVLVIQETGLDTSDLLVTVQKIRHQEIFGLEKYFVWGIEPRSVKVTSSAQKAGVLAEIREYSQSMDIAPRLRSLIEIVADEFLTNAIYNAPVDSDGLWRYTRRPRTESVELDPGEEVEVKFCCDGKRFGLSTTDPFGSLTPGQLQDYLARGYRRGIDQVAVTSGGAGLGFYQILDSLSHFVINIDPGHMTEMIGFVDVSGSYRTFASSGKSFNIFVKESADDHALER